MLTPYQFASNTPIQAIDLDGLEAFSIHGDVRVSALLTLSTSSGIVFDLNNNVGYFITPGVGGGYIGGFSGGFGVSVYPTAETIYDTKGLGVSVLASGFVGVGLSLSVDYAIDQETPNDSKLGGSAYYGGGLEAGAAAEATYTFLWGTTWEDIGKWILGTDDDNKEKLKNSLHKAKDILNQNLELLNSEIDSMIDDENADCDVIDSLINKADNIEKTMDSISNLEKKITKQ